uniref:Origin recognition complex subunit 3 n=1 Tax=Paramormyrops kingsleyae TaxID=1676925 RepID=A0A3B3T8S7_9TELE|nr:origin recognition complex subunit 3 [Paramormyrops kingsleyae]
MATSSVSKGCFVFKPTSKKRKTLSAEDYFTDGSENPENSRLRFQLFQSQWQDMKEEVQMVHDDLNKKILDSLLEFIGKSVASFQSRAVGWESRMRASEIPTAALVLGVNVPDHDVTFQSLSDLLRESVSPFVASVQAKECGALQHLMKKVMQQLMGGGVALDEDDAEEQSGYQISDLPRKGFNCSLGILCDWYQNLNKKSCIKSPGKKRSSSGSDFPKKPPLVVIFKDLEAFCPQVLQDFIVICSQYIQQLPLVFVFGIATSPSTIQRMLPHSVSSLLCIELFQSLSCTQHLATVIDKLVLTSKFPFKISGKVLKVLVGIFLYHDFSVCNFIRGLQLALFEHFFGQPLSVLCCEEEEALAQVRQFSHEDVEKILQLPSIMRYVEKQEPQEQVKLLTSDDHVKVVTQNLLKDLCSYHRNFYPILRCLHLLTSSLPKFPLGKQIRELHVLCLENNVWESEEYESAMQLLRMLAKDELVAALQKCVEVLQPGMTKKLKEVVHQLKDIIAKLKMLDQLSDETISCEGEQESSSGKSLQKTDLFHLQKTLMEMRETRRNKAKTPYEVLRNHTVDYLDSLVKMHLLPPESQPLYEVFYYSSSATVRRHLNATPRTSIQTALSHPHYYLQSEALKSEGGTISKAAPDICIIYKLHLECGRLINLYDWLQAYFTVTAADGQDPDSAEGHVDEMKHARFIRAVSELEFLGFIKSTKQKTDHVARLTWGGCQT